MRKNCENGRSMVEMLGVLAIIGVLSVGGIAGYSKAMFKYKMNQTLDMISHIVTRITELYNGDIGNYIGSREEMKKLGVFTDCVEYENDVESCKLPVTENGKYSVSLKQEGGGIYLHLEGREAIDVCVAFLSSGIYKNAPDDWWYPNGYIAIDREPFYGKSPEAIANGAKSEITSSDIANACSICADTTYGTPACRVYWIIKNDI